MDAPLILNLLALLLGVHEIMVVLLMVALNDNDGVLLAVPPTDNELVGVELTVLERLTVVDPLSLLVGVCDAVGDAVLVPLPVEELVAVTDSLAVGVVESVPLSLPVNDGPAPFVTDAVGE